MKFHDILFKKLRLFCGLLFCISITGTISAQNEPKQEFKAVSVNLKVVDENGTPVPKAQVAIGEGLIQTETDGNGACSIIGNMNSLVTVSAPGYEKSVTPVQDIIMSNTIKLVKSKLFMTSDDEIVLPFITQNKRSTSGSAIVITGDQLEKYPSIDLRNAFTGLVPGLFVRELDGSSGLSPEENNSTYRITKKIEVSARGHDMIYIVDNIPVDITELALDPQEIESVTIIKDIVGKAMFGPLGAEGIIFIKTKRGKIQRSIMTVKAETGISVIDRFPGVVSGADYARLNNQARENDGMEPLYSQSDITAYAKNDPYDMYHPSIDFRNMMIKNTKPFRRANVSSSGGGPTVQYSSYIGYNGEGDIYKIGPTADYNRIIGSTNVDISITNDIKVQFDIRAGIFLRRSPNYGYATSESSALTDIIELNSVLPHIKNTPPNAFPVYANNDPSLKYPWFGVSSVYPDNPVGNLIANGDYTETGRNGTVKFGIDYDLSRLIKGLKSHTFYGFDVLDLLRIGNAQNYWAYISTPSVSGKTGNDTILFSKVHDGEVSPELSNLHDYYYKRFDFFEKLSYQRSFGIHDIQSTLTYFLYKYSRNGFEEPMRQQNGIWSLSYSNNDKYFIHGVLNYAGTYTLQEGQRYKLFPAVGAGWVISDENFLSGLKFINYLKLRAEAGILGCESAMSPFLYRDRWVPTTGSQFGPYTSGTRWFGTTNQSTVNTVYPNRIGNPDLTWEKRKEFNIGIDALMANHKLSLEVNFYNILDDGIITRLYNTVPYITGYSSALPYSNYNKIRYFGVETGIQFTDKAGEFGYSFGGNATVQNSKVEKYDEPAYRFAYQTRVGKAADAYWGQTCLGKFANDADALVIPHVYDEVLKVGDLKYKDMNDDGIIDDNDQSAIGHTIPRVFYALNAYLKYKNFEITAIGTGAALFDLPLTNSYFWNGWGDNNYSNFVKDNIGGDYPRLTYYKVNNNFINSDFWLTKGDYFKIQNVELAYTIPANKLQIIRSQGMRIYIRGANLLTISQIRDVDPESINSGVTGYPLFRTITGGIKLTF